ncbi:MAG: DUF3990 domain-containing protein [Muribaculaceae bacterium]|nr:DUF3990 domain-containing protein [Muribaculaceae bacterium]MDE7081788.1 DUF3990 domain-containing protein [Muribaculaceae bacterium]
MDKIEVYHAGTDLIEVPDCRRGRANLDFGRGFYVTDIYDQAFNLALSRAKERKLPALINTYLLDQKALLEEARSLIFNLYDEEWLEFIVACRAGKDIWQQYDYVEGGVADDRVIDTVNMYMQGYMSQERALQRLRYLRPNNQICIINQELLERHLTFTNCITLPQDGQLR